MKIISIFVEGVGYIHSDSDGEIIKIQKTGEMAMVDWYRKGDREFNSRYIIEVKYELPNL